MLLSFTQGEKELLKPFFKNSDIDSYWCNLTPEKYLLYIDRNKTDISDYPNVLRHLNKYRSLLESRREVKTNVIKYFQLQWPREETIFHGEKIVVPYRSLSNTFAYNNVPWYCRSDCYVIKPKTDDYHIKYILGLLNCSLYYFWFYTKGKRKGNTLELFQTPLSETPIKKLPTNEQILLSSIVDQILLEIYSIDFAINFDRQKVVKNLKREIDEMVYTSFRLSKSEMKDIDEFIKSKKINL